MSAPPPKRQKREQYRKKAAAAASKDAPGHIKLPQKKFYRQRAHANPFSDHQLIYPLSPAHMDWSTHYPAFVDSAEQTNLAGARKLDRDVEVVDIGCGFGGLLVGLAPVLPETLMVGMEIRTQVTEYLTTRIQALRTQQRKLKDSESPAPVPDAADASADADADGDSETPAGVIAGGYQNISALRANTMKFFPNFFGRRQLSKIFICFPDPHFKARKHKARIISENLNAEYAYALRPGGMLYTITDVEEYHHWILRHFREEGDQPSEGGVKDLFERVTEEELERDPCVAVMKEATEEGKKVTRNKGNKYVAVFRRKADPEWS
ncbi:hypothetical protein BDV25DRAFT_138183 [Aspergillus avenaceus]|uniref:tRNA (guanine-N(7)-)-methyltransferase n=1 Tax=Aspergillus avenaceus TaxID=36643 RepID=A0A5N6U0L2_ASPAV|nr:hypothetical protein BDV25DRAFT_138183 [Aspergillus avenaceus]